MFYIADEDEIKGGKVTDVYFKRTLKILKQKSISKKVKVEFIVKSLPSDWKWGVFAGLEEAIDLLSSLNVDVWAIPEGTFFGIDEPVLIIEGKYEEFGIYETAILGMLCQTSGIATKSARCKIASLGKPVISFGARRIYPAIAPMVERNAYIGGCDGVACIKSAELLNLEPVGTIPHALILIFGDTVKAIKAFDEIIEPKVNRIALIDTFEDEKFEAIKVAQAMGKKLFAVRLDTPESRRGNFLEILKEVRWELDLRGFRNVKILVSGGIDEYKILELNPYADAYGVGTSISSAPVLDFAMDIVEIEGKPIAKRGKLSGAKRFLRCPNCFRRKVIPVNSNDINCECGEKMEDLLVKLIDNGKLVKKLPSLNEIKNYVLSQYKYFSL